MQFEEWLPQVNLIVDITLFCTHKANWFAHWRFQYCVQGRTEKYNVVFIALPILISMAGKFNVKCGVIASDGQINQDIGFKFFTWVATSNTAVENQVTLAERVRTLYPDMIEPYQIVCIGN